MTTVTFRGDAQLIPQVDTILVAGSWAAAETVTLTINGKDIVLTLGSTSAASAAAVATAIYSALANSTVVSGDSRTTNGAAISEFVEMTYSVSSATVTITGKTTGNMRGAPWVLTVSTDSASGTLTHTSESTDAESPFHWNVGENWDTGDPPGYGDDVIVSEGKSIRYGMLQVDTFTVLASTDVFTLTTTPMEFRNNTKVRVSTTGTLPTGLSDSTTYYVISADPSAGTIQLSTSRGGSAVNCTDAGSGTHTIYVQLASIRTKASYTGDLTEGQIGLPRLNTSQTSTGTFVEYRNRNLVAGITVIDIGEGTGNGSGRLQFDTRGYTATMTVWNTATPDGTGRKSIEWTGTGTNVLNVLKGSVDVFGAMTLTSRIGYTDDEASDSDVRFSEDVVHTAITQSGGNTDIDSTVTTLNMNGGAAVMHSGNLTTLNGDSGTLTYNGSGTITTPGTLGRDFTLDFSKGQLQRVVTNKLYMLPGSKLLDGNGKVTYSGDIQIYGKVEDVTLDVGDDRTLSVS